MDLSVVVPLYNEEESIKPLYRAITEVMGAVDLTYEIVFVDDGSSDNTYNLARDLARVDGRVRVLKFRKNYGQTPAMAAGIEHARARMIVTMDGDLQNDPADIPRFVEKISEGYDIVVGWRHNRQDDLVKRQIPSKIANWLIGKVTGVAIKDNGCSLKAYRAEVIREIPLYSEMHRFIPAMTSLAGARLIEIKVKHHARKYGTSKYGLSRIYKVLLDLLSVKTIIAFAAKPLLWFSLLALPGALVSGVTLGITLYEVLTPAGQYSIPVAGTGVLFGALTVILVLSGVLVELVYKTGDTKLDKLSSLTIEELRPKTHGPSSADSVRL